MYDRLRKSHVWPRRRDTQVRLHTCRSDTDHLGPAFRPSRSRTKGGRVHQGRVAKSWLQDQSCQHGWRKSRELGTRRLERSRSARSHRLRPEVRVFTDYKLTFTHARSETTVGVIANQRTDVDLPLLPIGRPTGNNVIHILSPSLEPVPLGCVGEICVGGEQVTRGYVRTELNAKVFVDHPRFGRIYKTGDLGRFLGDGEGSIDCLGRIDGQVKVNGLRYVHVFCLLQDRKLTRGQDRDRRN